MSAKSPSPWGWRAEPTQFWSLTGPESMVLDISPQVRARSGPRYQAVRTIPLLEGGSRLWRLSAWMKITAGNTQRDALLKVELHGDSRILKTLREFRPDADWTYFEKTLRLPGDLKEAAVVVSFEGRVGKAEVRDLSLTPAVAPAAAFTLEPAGPSKFPWLVKDRSYRLCGRIARADAGAPVWADFDFRRLLLAAGTRVPPDLAVGSARNDLLILLNRSLEGPGVVEPHRLDFSIFKAASSHSSSMALKPTIFDWNGDGKNDLLITDWSGECQLFLNESRKGTLRFSPPQKLQQQGGALSVADSPMPWIVDWDGDGKNDLLASDVSGRIIFFRNIGSADQPDWQAGEFITNENGEPFCLTALNVGAKRPIQGPAEWNWGYLSVATWDLTGNGALDLIINDSLGRLSWIHNKGRPGAPRLEARPRPFTYKGKPVITPWRDAPGVYDWDGDGYPELLVLDEGGNLVMLHLDRKTPGVVSRIEPMLDAAGNPVVINNRTSPITPGVRGRANFTVGDVDGDGKPDVIAGYSSYYIGGGSFLFLHNVGTASHPRFETAPMRVGGGRFAEWTGSDGHDQWHSGGVCLFDWNGDGRPDLFHGVESGRFAYYGNDYLNRKDFPVFEPLEFSRKDAAGPVTLLDFSHLPAGGLAFHPARPVAPLQWLPQESVLKSTADKSRGRQHAESRKPDSPFYLLLE